MGLFPVGGDRDVYLVFGHRQLCLALLVVGEDERIRLHGCDQIGGAVGDGHRIEPFDDLCGVEAVQVVVCQEFIVDGLTAGRRRRGFRRGRGGASGENEGGGERRGGGDDQFPRPGRGGVGHGVIL